MADEAKHAVIRKVLWRLIPFCVLCFLLNYIDRVNISVAKLKMGGEGGLAWFSEDVYSLGAAVFFVGYFVFELPSNLIQQRVGPRRWIARIMVSWGVISMCFMFVQGPWSFYLLRFLLGVAEAGFFPGVILYLSHWVPQEYRARASALFLTSTAISGVIGNPLSGWILYVTEKHESFLASWQWLFLVEGLPSVALGLVTWFYLTDSPAEARWLTEAEQKLLTDVMASERREHPASHVAELKDAFRSRYTWLLSGLYGMMVFGFYTVNFYTPTIIKQALLNAGTITKETPPYAVYLRVGLLAAIPFGIATVAMVVIARHSDKHNERKFHLALACVLLAVGLALAGVAPRLATGESATVVTIIGLSIGAMGAFGMFGPFWSLPPQFLTGTAVAAAFAIVNSIGNLFGGFFGGWLYTKLPQEGALLLAAGLGLMALITTLASPIQRGVKS